MDSNILFKSNNNNNYYFDEFQNKILFMHPVIAWLYMYILVERGNIDDLREKGQIEIPDYGTTDLNEIIYYYDKLLFLKKKNYFTNKNYFQGLIGEITPETVECSLANSNNIVFEVTDLCNLKCAYCAFEDLYDTFDRREGKMLMADDGIILIEYLKKYWDSNLNYSHNRNINIGFYGGEPLLNMKFIRTIVNYTQKINCNNYNFSYSMTTNATHLDKHIEYLVENNFLLTISLDGNEINNAFRIFKNGGGSYNKVLNNIKLIQSKYPDFFDKNISFNSVLHANNSVFDICEYFSENFGQLPQISQMSKVGQNNAAKEKFKQIFKDFSKEINDDFKKSKCYDDNYFQFPDGDLLRTFVHRFSGFVVKDYHQLIYGDHTKFIPSGTCLPFSKKLFLTVNGKILPCERVGHNFSLGNISNGRLSLDTVKIAEKYSNYFKTILKSCKICSTNRLCSKCVFHINIEDNNIKCPDILTNSKIEKIVGDIMTMLENYPTLYYRALKETN